MKRTITLVITIFITSQLFSQIMGLSNSKIQAYSTENVAQKNLEFEPSFGYLWATKHYNNDGKLESFSESGDSTITFRDMIFRFTYGIAKNMEAGFQVSSDLTSASMGIKYKVFTKNKFSAAVMAGGTFSNESDITIVNTGVFGETWSLAGGIVLTNDFSERWSADLDIQYQNVMDKNLTYSNDVFLNTDVAYILKNTNQIVGGFSYTNNAHTNNYDGVNSYLLNLNLGANINTSNMFCVVVSVPVSLAGKNHDRLNGFNLFVTIFLD